MNAFFDDVLVGAILLAGFGYATYALGPKTLRGRILTGLSTLFVRASALPGAARLVERLSAAAAVKSKGACGGCDNCGSTAVPQSVSAEVRIPLAQIGKRR